MYTKIQKSMQSSTDELGKPLKKSTLTHVLRIIYWNTGIRKHLIAGNLYAFVLSVCTSFLCRLCISKQHLGITLSSAFVLSVCTSFLCRLSISKQHLGITLSSVRLSHKTLKSIDCRLPRTLCPYYIVHYFNFSVLS